MKPKSKPKKLDHIKTRFVGLVDRIERGSNQFTVWSEGRPHLNRKLKDFIGHEVTVTIEVGDKLN